MQLKKFIDLTTSSYSTLKSERDLAESHSITTDMTIKDDPDIKDFELDSNQSSDHPVSKSPELSGERIDPVPRRETSPNASNDCSEMDNEEDSDQDAMSLDDVSDTMEVKTGTSTPSVIGCDIKFPILDHDVFLKVQDDLQRNEEFANSLVGNCTKLRTTFIL